MTPLLIAAGGLAGFWLLAICFIGVMWCKHRYRSGELSVFWQAIAIVGFAIGLPLDILFNLVVGTVMYLELPPLKRVRGDLTLFGRTFAYDLRIPELTFTSRCSRHKADAGWRGRLARWWCRQLEQVDPGHC